MTRTIHARLTDLERQTDTSSDVAVVLYEPGTEPVEPPANARAVVYLPANHRDHEEPNHDRTP